MKCMSLLLNIKCGAYSIHLYSFTSLNTISKQKNLLILEKACAWILLISKTW